MYGLVSERLNEGATGPVAYPIPEIIARLNEAYRFFVLLTLGLETTQPWNVPVSQTFTHMLSVFPDWIAPLRLATAAGAKVRPARLEVLASLDSAWIASPGTPQRYIHLGADFLGVYQQPASAGTVLNVTYVRAPKTLVLDTDVPEVPAEYHPKLVDYGVYGMREAEGAQEFQKSLVFLNSFFDGAQHYAAYVRARNIGSRYDKVPFELEKFDRSLLLKLRADLLPARKTKTVEV